MKTMDQPAFADLYHQALANPTKVTEDELLQLILKFPYSQPLRFAYEKKQFLEHQQLPNISSTLLYANSPNWLFEYITKPIQDFSTLIQAAEEELIVDIIPELEEHMEADPAAEQDALQLDQLIQGAVSAKDYFQESIEEKLESPLLPEPIAPTPEPVDAERVSIYNDNLMPYSFLWWLHKTRLEYAHTYQPYANPMMPKASATDTVVEKVAQHIDAQTLDQQIKENIFHLQAPESKLGEEFKQTVPFQVHKKTDEVIEKFIREDPQIKPPQPDKINTENKARKSSEDQFTLVTETLARIYAEQGLYPKAIEVYRKLILKIPEKNSYFATQIRELEKKIN